MRRGQAHLPGLRDKLTVSVDFTLKAFQARITLTCDQLMVGKVGLPPLVANGQVETLEAT
jgi:hypothetical protein